MNRVIPTVTILCLAAGLCSAAEAGDKGRPMGERKTIYCQTVEQYNAFDPDRAEAEAARDIASGELRLFFRSAEEVPEVIAVDEGLAERLPPYTWVGIGGGCTDEINDDDVSEAYRTAFQRAERYGELYNQVLARHYRPKEETPMPPPGSVSAPPPYSGGAMNRTREFLGDEAGWEAIRMELRDIQPIHGGRDVTVSGSGKGKVTSVRSGAGMRRLKKRVLKLRLEGDDIRRLAEVFIANDFLTIVLPDETVMPDTGNPTITLTNGKGESHTLDGWDNKFFFPDSDPMDPTVRFDRVYRAILRIERLALEE